MKQTWLCLFLTGICWKQALAAPMSCDSSCQSAQRAALVDLYTSTKGSEWYNPGPWPNFTTSTDFATICTIIAESYIGFCCDSSQPACDMTAGDRGISALIMADMNMQGSLPTSFISSMAPTMLCFVAVGKPRRSLNLSAVLHADLLMLLQAMRCRAPCLT